MFIAIGNILVALVIIGMNITELPAVFALFFKSAFDADSLFGDILGSAIA